ncbi:unnamed protein product [Phyllotreta striolata]|uniref:THAP-type domain-containing protein n=1 Tax=Phyllotreta striolata TaxID=444603 RepID=A0A9N9XRT6_PHYSR|nr:unnamed protein product [Phyllotreta striolata]
MVRCCCVPQCTNKDATRHYIPSDKLIQEIWIKRIDNPNLYNKSYNLLKGHAVCDVHFADICRFGNKLKKYSLPTINLPAFEDRGDPADCFSYPKNPFEKYETPPKIKRLLQSTSFARKEGPIKQLFLETPVESKPDVNINLQLYPVSESPRASTQSRAGEQNEPSVMGKRCVVENCTTKCNTKGRSIFRVPKDPHQRTVWQNNLNISVPFKDTDVVCERHFDPECVFREWVHKDSDGKIIAKVRYGHPRLADYAVPSIFITTPTKPDDSRLTDSPDDHDYACLTDVIKVECNPTNIQTASELTNPQSPVPATISNHDTETSSTPVPAYQKYLSLISKSWSVTELPVGENIQFVFSYTITLMDNGINVPITQKCITLDEDKYLEYFIYGRRVDAHQTGCVRILTAAEALPGVLAAFKRVNICHGIGNVAEFSVLVNIAFRDYVQQWRHNECSMVGKTKRCEACRKLRKRLLQQASRDEARATLRRFRAPSSPSDRLKLDAVRKKYLREKRRGEQARKRVEKLETALLKLSNRQCKIP